MYHYGNGMIPLFGSNGINIWNMKKNLVKVLKVVKLDHQTTSVKQFQGT